MEWACVPTAPTVLWLLCPQNCPTLWNMFKGHNKVSLTAQHGEQYRVLQEEKVRLPYNTAGQTEGTAEDGT